MAKWGEGDPRWIVEERPDATNVNNWHWTEKNATPWSKERLRSLLLDFKIAKNDIECSVIEIDKLDGEATANNRKGKLIFFYEWNIVLKWSGYVPGSESVQKGKATIPNLSEENDLDEIEITITIDDPNEESEKLKIFMYNYGRDKIREQLGAYLKELKQEYSKGLLLPKKDESGNPVKSDSVSTINSGFNKTQKFNNTICMDDKNTNSAGCKVNTETIQLTINFQCRANEIYDVLTRREMVSAFTRGEAKVDPIKGGEFVLFGGNVYGKFEELVPNQKIAQTWRLKTWPNGIFSNVTININEKTDHTEIKLVQSGIPANEVQATKNNWERYYWNSIKQTFGFGSFLV